MNDDIIKKAFNKGVISPEDIIKYYEQNKNLFDIHSTGEKAGSEFGKFRLIKLLGRGLCEVHLAYDNILKREVALKILTGTSPQDFQRFYREAVLCAKLDHPNIVHIYEIGEVGGKHYISMQYIEGQSLEEAGLSVEESLNVIAAISHAVEYAHGLGIMHRDIKPGNILIDKAGKPYLSDFGIAKRIELTREKEKISITGMIIGTPSFMSPEQAHGDKIDYMSDIYSLGATLYYLVTGKEPFVGSTVMQVINKVINEDPALPRSLNKVVPPEVEAIIMKAMSKEKDRRYLAAIELSRDIERYLRGDPISARPTSVLTRAFRKIKRNKLLIPMTVLMVMLIVIFGYAIFQWIKKMDTVRQYKKQAEEYYTKGDLEKAREYYMMLKQLATDNDVSERLALIDAKLSAKRRAAEELNRWLLMLEDANKKFYSKQTTPEEVQKLMQELISKLDEITELYPLENAYYYRGKLYREQGRYDHAIKDLTKALELLPDFSLAHLELIKLKLDILLDFQLLAYVGSASQFTQSTEDIRRYLEKLRTFKFEAHQAQKVVTIANIVQDLLMKRELTNALKVLNDLSEGQLDEDIYNLVAIVYALLNNQEKARQYIGMAIDIKPTLARSYLYKGFINQRLKRLDEAFGDYSKALSYSPYLHAAYLYRSSIYLIKRDLESAVAEISRAIEISNLNGGYYWWRGMLLLLQHKFNDAITDLDTAVKLIPDWPEAYLHRGYAKLELADYDGAIKDFQKITQLLPTDYRGYYTLGVAFCDRLKDYQEAIKQFSHAIELKTDHTDSFKWRGISYYYAGDYKNALDDLTKACELSAEIKSDPSIQRLIEDCRRRLNKD